MKYIWLKSIILLFLLVGCSSASSLKRVESVHYSGHEQTRIARAVDSRLKQHPDESGFIPLPVGEESLATRLDLANASEQSLDLQYYIWKDDLSGLILLSAVKRAAERGVRVRLLLDNLNEARLQKDFKIFATHSNIEVRVINPYFKFINHRMHNKSFTADNKAAIIGGRNIGDEYFGGSKVSNFTDFDVLLVGPVVNQISDEFDLYWNSDRSFPIEDVVKDAITEKDHARADESFSKHIEAVRTSDFVNLINKVNITHQLYWGKTQLLYDEPSKLTGENKNNILSDVRNVFKDVKKELILISPYFIPGKEGVKNLTNLRKSGVHIIVLTNSMVSNDVSSVFGGYRRYREKLLEQGIEIYETRPKASSQVKKGHSRASGSMGLHGKVIIADRKKMFVGSMNLDSRSKNLNTEMGVVLESKELASLSAKQIIEALPAIAYELKLDDHQIEWIETNGDKTKTYEVDPHTTWWKRTKTWFFSLFIPESLL